MGKRSVFFLTLVWLAGIHARAEVSLSDTLMWSRDSLKLPPEFHTEYLAAPPGYDLKTTAKADAWQKIAGKWPKLSTDLEPWFRFQVTNLDDPRTIYVNVWGKERVRAYVLSQKDTVASFSGIGYSKKKRTLAEDGWYIPLYIPKGETVTVYLNFGVIPTAFPHHLVKEYHNSRFGLHSSDIRTERLSGHIKSQSRDRVLFYASLGVFIVFCLFSLSLYITDKDDTYLYYTFYLIMTLSYSLFADANSLAGFQPAEYFPLLKNYLPLNLIWIGYWFWYQFAARMLEIKTRNPLFYSWYSTLIYWLLVPNLLAFVYFILSHDHGLFFYWLRVSALSLLATLFLFIYYIFRRNASRWVNYFRWAVSVFLFIGMVSFLKYDFIDFEGSLHFLNEIFVIRTAVMLDVFILAVAIGEKIKWEQQERITIEKKYYETRKAALQARLNPHFIFNSLNAARNLVDIGHTVKASEYLTGFSVFLRNSLHAFDREIFTLEDELQLACQFLQMEHIRSNASFSYSFHVDETVPLADIPVPTLLLQPLLENAIWHGANPQELSDISVHVEYISDQESQIRICDQGMGLPAAKLAETLSDQTLNYGLKLFDQKIRLHNRQSFLQISWHTDNNIPSGTCFVINLNQTSV